MGNKKPQNLIKIVAISFILVVCPGASWYYLQKGLNYQKDARKELIVKNQLEVQSIIPEYLTNDSTFLDNRLRLILLNDNHVSVDKVKKLTDKLTEQFEDSKGVFLLEILEQKDNLELMNTQVHDMHVIKQLSSEEYDKLVSSTIGQPIFKTENDRVVVDEIQKGSSDKQMKAAYAILVDQNNGIRNFYDINDSNRIKSMVEHMAILIPRVDIEKAELIREKEM